ncbi:cytosolic sulfotransferase 12-like [Pyrus ussuriensis x Pyrus communis]|uniref:Sulfotransferase n=1 Tax=Pyrus ussuriensis x Pyrus communis TaxID=2448454 RepID=A0A5N5HDZ7_9ROSA|nr:cytosolic sulfotransferase 12-like [Pyrus ussuriensis x Pyrus communis]
MKTPQPPPPVVPRYLQEKELSQEDKDFIFSLPTEKGWVADGLHKYHGFWLSTKQMHGVLACQKHFQAVDSDIVLVTTLKSGTTWLKALLFALVKRAHYLDPQRHPLLTENPHVLVPCLEFDVYTDKQVLPDLSSLPRPRLISTHLPYVCLPDSVKHSGCKVVYACREPKDVFVSLWHYSNKLRPVGSGTMSLDEAFDKFCRGVSLSGPFWDHVLGFWKESLKRPESAFFIKYEEMKQEPTLHLRRLAEFLGCPFSPEEETHGVVDGILRLCSFDNLSNLVVNKSGKLPAGIENSAFFRKGEVGDWMNSLTPEMVKKLDSITQEKLHGSRLKF